ncbi:NPR2-domain-containing protein [Schizopora paradoxa]|uniref:NPR2-domain-containing protein n=1 Tax=Schizopora paradoxa TaxID=27342 RepID=A0A0H2RIW7_9AGAM|nr:NPR2-domain-containing protein [Schizopora paradoxa]
MNSEGTSFLPRILSVFYAVFHNKGGTNIVYQVPEGLISTAGQPEALSSAAGSPSSGQHHSTNNSAARVTLSRDSSSSHNSRLADSRETFSSSAQKRNSSAQRVLFKFEDISRYVIPPRPLCGRLVTCATRRYRIIGFPVELYNEDRYERNFFRYNVCFVFDREADLSCYEPIVRKIGRVLTACEEESLFLSSPETSHSIHAILEQLYEDLNSYSETSIPIDKFNSIELKIFPFYPNPPPVHDWSVPVALINLKKRIEDNWDLTMTKVCQYIDGTNHVKRIAYLADCDVELTRSAISHLLYYQVIMTIDIFQYSNMYTLCRSIEWLADETHVREECGPYVTRRDREVSSWADLLHLYSRLKAGITIYEWMQEYDVHRHGIDPRRFVSFGVIKGFLRRVHRWPVLLPEKDRKSPTVGRRRGRSLNMSISSVIVNSGGSASPTNVLSETAFHLNGSSTRISDNTSSATNGLARTISHGDQRAILTSPVRRGSHAEKYLEQFRKEIDAAKSGGAMAGQRDSTSGMVSTSPRTTRFVRPHHQQVQAAAQDSIDGVMGGRRYSLQQPMVTQIHTAGGLQPSNSLSGPFNSSSGDLLENASGLATPTRPRLSRSPSAQTIGVSQGQQSLQVPPGLKDLLDGTRHSDELGVQFEAGWPLLEKYLVAIGGGRGDGDFGRVEIIYR